jgi:calcineurin-like phosphoesterase family protein
MRVWNKSHLNSWQLYGHSHGDLDPIGKQYDVGVDSNDFKPLSYEEIEDIIKKAPNNLNYIPIEQRTAIK